MRRIVVCLWLAGFALIISILLLLPSYFLSQVRANEARAELERSKHVLDTEVQPEDVTKEITAALRNANDLKPFTQPLSVYQLVRVFENKPTGIKITNISFTNGAPEQSKIIVEGKAPNRESLTTFGDLVEGRAEFASVELPVSNFVKEKDIDFSMTITVK